MSQITKDHSLLQEQIDAGLITLEQAAFSANKNLVTRAVGVEDTVLLENHMHDLLPGDTYLLCSDGLSDMLSDETIQQLLQAHDSLADWRPALVAAANDAGGKDNISVILARVHGLAAHQVVVAVSPHHRVDAVTQSVTICTCNTTLFFRVSTRRCGEGQKNQRGKRSSNG
jgi:serine/threonine protein phosphatase PrpC